MTTWHRFCANGETEIRDENGKFVANLGLDFLADEGDRARLIAAAPETAAERDRLKEINAELLETLYVAISYSDYPELWIPDACAAISKATGQALQDLADIGQDLNI